MSTTKKVDFDNNGVHDCADLDLLEAAIQPGSDFQSGFDLNYDRELNRLDFEEWMLSAGSLSLGGRFADGDANLDGVVDTSDLNIWNANKFTSATTVAYDGKETHS